MTEVLYASYKTNRRTFENQAPRTLHRCNFCTGTGVTDQLHLHCSGAEVVPNSLTVHTVLAPIVNQVLALLKNKVHITCPDCLTCRLSAHYFLECPSGFTKFCVEYSKIEKGINGMNENNNAKQLLRSTFNSNSAIVL